VLGAVCPGISVGGVNFCSPPTRAVVNYGGTHPMCLWFDIRDFAVSVLILCSNWIVAHRHVIMCGTTQAHAFAPGREVITSCPRRNLPTRHINAARTAQFSAQYGRFEDTSFFEAQSVKC
jgi:hypothetical protein